MAQKLKETSSRIHAENQYSKSYVNRAECIADFISECRTFQTRIMNMEYLTQPRTLSCDGSALFDFLAHSCFQLKTDTWECEQTIMVEKLKEKMIALNDMLNEKPQNICCNVAYMPCYMYDTNEVNIIPVFKIYLDKKVKCYVSFAGDIFHTLNDLLDSQTEHILICTPRGGEYEIEMSSDSALLEFFNLNSRIIKVQTISSIKTFRAIIEVGAQVLFFNSFWFKLGYGVCNVIASAILPCFDSEKDINMLRGNIRGFFQRMNIRCTAEQEKIISVDVRDGFFNCCGSRKRDYQSSLKKLRIDLNVLLNLSNMPILSLLLGSLFGVAKKESSGFFNGPGNALHKLLNTSEYKSLDVNIPFVVNGIVGFFKKYKNGKTQKIVELPTSNEIDELAEWCEGDHSLENFLRKLETNSQKNR